MSKMCNRNHVGFILSLTEWYNFALYATLSSVMGKLFFNQSNELSNLIYSFIILGTGYLSRPLGAIIFTRIKYTLNEDKSIFYSLLLMSISTIGIGCIPIFQAPYNNVSIVLLVLFRTLQGLALGGCYGAAYLYVLANAKPGYKNRATAGVCIGVVLGFLLANLTLSGLYWTIGAEAVKSGGWRIPFFFTGFLGLLTLYILHHYYLNIHYASKSTEYTPSFSINNKKLLLAGVLFVVGLEMMSFHSIFVFNPNFLMTVYHIDECYIFNQTMIIMCMVLVGIYLLSYLSDKTSPRFTLSLASILFILLAYNFPWVGLLDHIIGIALISACYASIPNWTINTLKRHKMEEHSGTIFNLSSAIFSSTTPVVVTSIVKYNPLFLQFGFIGMGLVMFIMINVFLKRVD